MTENKLFVSAGLEFIKEKAIKYGVWSPFHHQSDLNKVQYIHGAVVGLERKEWQSPNVPQLMSHLNIKVALHFSIKISCILKDIVVQ